MADPADLGLTADALRHRPAADPTADAGHDGLRNGRLTERDLDELLEEERFEPEAIQFATAEQEYSSDESAPLEDEVQFLHWNAGNPTHLMYWKVWLP